MTLGLIIKGDFNSFLLMLVFENSFYVTFLTSPVSDPFF